MRHRVYIGIGSNLGDRRVNILTALAQLRTYARIEAVSAFYESPPAEGARGPSFLNLAASLEVEDERDEFARRLEEIERSVGRLFRQRLEARPIDIDLLAFDSWEHPQLSQRSYNLVPLAEIAPAYAARAALSNGAAMRRLDHGLHFHTDRQREVPDVQISLGRAGVSRVRRAIDLEIDGKSRVVTGEFSMVADLASHRAGVHMSRFVESLEEAVLDVLARERKPTRIDRLVEAISRDIVATQGAGRADVHLRADFSLERWTPVSGKRGEEIYAAFAIARADDHAARSAFGVEAEGMTACPCAQGMMLEHSLHELRDAGFEESEAKRILDLLPSATHNQRGRGSLLLGVLDDAKRDFVRLEDLVEIVEGSMSSETYDLLKRPDEFFVVNKAHRNPKFVEDVVRGMVARVLETYPSFDDGSLVVAKQHNDESIHKHDAFAEVFGTLGEFRGELAGESVDKRTDLERWLDGR
jgi:GTP cyclohydrolase IV